MDMEKLMEEFGDGLLRLCTLYIKDSKLAEDAVQETFVRVWRHSDSFQGQCALKTWVTRIAINVCKSYHRMPWSKVDLLGEQETQIMDAHCCQSDSEFQTDTTLIHAIASLPKKYREVILLYYYQELDIKEIAQALESNSSTVGVRLKRGRERLKPMLKEWYYDED